MGRGGNKESGGGSVGRNETGHIDRQPHDVIHVVCTPNNLSKDKWDCTFYDRRDNSYPSSNSKGGEGVRSKFASSSHNNNYPSEHGNSSRESEGTGRAERSTLSSHGSSSSGGGISVSDNHFALQNKFSTYNVGYGKIHSNPVIGENLSSRSTSFVGEVINTIRYEVSKGTLHHKLVINAYNRGIVDGDLYHLGSKLSGSTGTTTSGVTLNLCLFDLHKNNITAAGMNNFIHFFKWQNINNVDFSSNQVGDKGCIEVAAALTAGWLPHLHSIDLSDNQITTNGYGYIANALKQTSQDIMVTLEKHSAYLGQTVIRPALKTFIKYAKESGVDTTNVVTDKNIFEYMKDIITMKVNFLIGFIKCKLYLDYLESGVTAADVGIEVIIKQIGKKFTPLDTLVCICSTANEVLTSPEGVNLVLKGLELLGNDE